MNFENSDRLLIAGLIWVIRYVQSNIYKSLLPSNYCIEYTLMVQIDPLASQHIDIDIELLCHWENFFLGNCNLWLESPHSVDSAFSLPRNDKTPSQFTHTYLSLLSASTIFSFHNTFRSFIPSLLELPLLFGSREREGKREVKNLPWERKPFTLFRKFGMLMVGVSFFLLLLPKFVSFSFQLASHKTQQVKAW